MQIIHCSRIKSIATATLCLCVATTSACAQEKPKRMIPGPSVRELISEAPNEKEDGITKITIGEVIKPGAAEDTHVGAKGLKDAPPLPTGFILFQDLVYRVRTEATLSGFQITEFKLPSVNDEKDFDRLAVLHLEYDLLSPGDYSWVPATVYPGGWDDRPGFVSRNHYDAVVPDFKLKRIAAVTEEFGIFAIALAPQSEPQQTGPFPEVTVEATSSPEPVPGGQEVTHTITFANKGTTAAAEVNFKEVFDPPLEYVSSDPSQGICKQKEAGNIIVCHLGPLAGGGQARVRIIARPRPAGIWKDRLELVTTLEVVFKEASTDFVDERGQIFTQFITTLIKKP